LRKLCNKINNEEITMSEQQNLEFTAREDSVSKEFLNKLNSILDKIGFRLVYEFIDVQFSRTTFSLQPICKPPSCESGQPSLEKKVQTVVFWEGKVVVIEGDKHLHDGNFLKLPPGFTVKMIK